MKILRRRLSWVLQNGAVVGLAWYGVVEGVEWAANILRFLIPLVIALYVLLLIGINADAAIKRKAKEAGPSVPGWLNLAYDLALALFLAAHGWFVYAGLVMVLWALSSALYAPLNTEEVS